MAPPSPLFADRGPDAMDAMDAKDAVVAKEAVDVMDAGDAHADALYALDGLDFGPKNGTSSFHEFQI